MALLSAVFDRDSRRGLALPERPKTLRVAGRVCDGVILGTGFDLDVMEWAQARMAEAVKEAGRALSEIDVMPAGMICVDDDGALARRRVRSPDGQSRAP